MSKETLPLKVDPFRFADHATRLHGTLPVKNFQRLSASLAANQGEIEADVRFGIDDEGVRFIEGRISTHLALQCQRCMEPFDYGIMGSFLLGIVQTEEEVERLPDRYDPVVVKDADLFLQDVIEDELIVSLPIVPMHESEDCKIQLPLVAESEEVVAVEKDNPFKVIELLRTKRDKK